MILGKFVVWAIGFVMQDPGLNRAIVVPEATNGGRASVTKVDTSIVPVYSGNSRGTAFFIELNGTKLLITAAHVCGQSEVMVSPRGIHRVLVSRPDKDICVASAYQGVTTLTVGSDAIPGEDVMMNGFPGNLEYDVQYGTAKEAGLSMFNMPTGYYASPDGSGCAKYTILNGDGKSCTVPITTTALNILARGGNSGGPVVRMSDGAVVGILIGTDGQSGYAAPISELIGIFEGRP